MAPNLNLSRLHDAGVSIWLDTLSRELLHTGEFAELIRDYSVTGGRAPGPRTPATQTSSTSQS